MLLAIYMLQLQFQFPFWDFFQRRMHTWPNLITKNDLEVKSHDWWFSRYSLVLVAMFNVWDLISRYIPLVECLKLESRKGLMIASLSRYLLVPAFYFTAKYGDQGWMIMLTSFLGLTNGYLSVCVLTEAPKGYKVSPSTCCYVQNVHVMALHEKWLVKLLFWFCRGLNKMRWAICLCCAYLLAYFQGLSLIGCGS